MISNCTILIIWLCAPNSLSNSLVYTKRIIALPSVQACIGHSDVTFGEIFRIEGRKKTFLTVCVAKKATRPLATIQGSIIRVPRT